jgi:aromatic-L-amino-acid decarboxylase
MAGSAMILPECRAMWDGSKAQTHWSSTRTNGSASPSIARSTSFAIPASGARDVDEPDVLQSSADDEVKNLRNWGLPLGRRFRALKLWFLIREQGIANLQARLRRDLENARWLEQEIRATPSWRILAPSPSRRCACVTSPTEWKEMRSIATPSHGRSGSIVRVQRTSRRPRSTVAGWCAFR